MEACLHLNTEGFQLHNMVVYQPPNMADYPRHSTGGYRVHKVGACLRLRQTCIKVIFRRGPTF